MKRYSTSTVFKFWIQKLARILILATALHAQAAQKKIFNDVEHDIVDSEIARFKKECTHISILDESKLQEIQKFYASKKSQMTEKQNDCVESNMTQLVATHNIYKETCDEITPKERIKNDTDAARLFVNVRKLKDGIRSYHEKLNECLILAGAQRDLLLPFVDYESNNRTLSKKLRELNLNPPFRENGVEYR